MNRAMAVALFLSAGAARAQVDVLTANYDNNRTSANLNEWILNAGNVTPDRFGKLYSYPVDGEVYAQPLYVHSLNIPGTGVRNVLYVATMHNSIYAFDADASGGTAPLWHLNLGTSVDPASFSLPGVNYTDILNEIGVLSTPVIDRAGNTIYLVNETPAAGDPVFFLHALDLTTGAEKLNGPVQIQAGVPGTGWGGTGDAANGVLPLQAGSHLQRPGLLLANNTVYVGFGSHGDYPPWHGWIVAYDSADLTQQTAVFNTTPSTAGSAIWQGGRGLAADPQGNIYCSTGNGNYDGVMSWGESVLRLTPTLSVADWFTPAEYAGWTSEDLDFGSSGPILVPGTNLLIAGGKAGLVALADRTNMGREVDGDAGVLQTFQAVPNNQFAIFNAALWNGPAGPLFYLWGYLDAVREFKLQNNAFNTTAVATNANAKSSLPFSGMTISSNPYVAGSGVLWATSVNPGTLPAPGELHAFDALNVSQELWNSSMRGSRDTLGNFVKFANPTVANGKVYVATASQEVVVYGLLQVPGIVSVVSSASFTNSTVAPGELISVFGNGIGPASPLGPILDSQGRIATSRGGYTVFFDGNPAPILYASQGQINTVAPFGIAGQSTTLLQVAAPDGTRFSETLPVGTAAPGIFALGTSGQGAILNSDYSLNSPSRPAARGGYVSVYATGTGLLNQTIVDGTLIPAANLPTSLAPVSVTIGGQPSTVSYQGAAPGYVAGLMQINVQVPANISPGNAVPVTISAGGTAGLNTVTMAVN